MTWGPAIEWDSRRESATVPPIAYQRRPTWAARANQVAAREPARARLASLQRGCAARSRLRPSRRRSTLPPRRRRRTRRNSLVQRLNRNDAARGNHHDSCGLRMIVRPKATYALGQNLALFPVLQQPPHRCALTDLRHLQVREVPPFGKRLPAVFPSHDYQSVVGAHGILQRARTGAER